MAVLIQRRSLNIPEWSTSLLGTNAQDSANPLSRLLSRYTGEFWRTAGVVEAANDTALPTSGTGTAIGASTVQLGKEAGTDGTANRATTYRNTSTTNAYVRSVSTFAVQGRRRYTITLTARRTTGSSTSGNLIHALHSNGTLYALSMTNLAQGTAYQTRTLTFDVQEPGYLTIYFMVNTGTLEYALDTASIRSELIYAAGTRTTYLWMDAGSIVPINHVLLRAPRDYLLPPAGSTIRLGASAASQFGTDMLDTGNVTFSMGSTGYWSWIKEAGIQARYLWMAINWPASTPYLNIGRFYAGSAFIPTRRQNYDGHDVTVNDAAYQSGLRSLGFGLSYLTLADADALDAIGLGAGTQEQVLVIPRSDLASRTAIIGSFSTPPACHVAAAPLGQRFATSIAVSEDL